MRSVRIGFATYGVHQGTSGTVRFAARAVLGSGVVGVQSREHTVGFGVRSPSRWGSPQPASETIVVIGKRPGKGRDGDYLPPFNMFEPVRTPDLRPPPEMKSPTAQDCARTRARLKQLALDLCAYCQAVEDCRLHPKCDAGALQHLESQVLAITSKIQIEKLACNKCTPRYYPASDCEVNETCGGCR